MSFFKKIYFLLAPLAAERVQGGHGHGEKKMAAPKKSKEREKELFCATHTVFSYGGWQQD